MTIQLKRQLGRVNLTLFTRHACESLGSELLGECIFICFSLVLFCFCLKFVKLS